MSKVAPFFYPSAIVVFLLIHFYPYYWYNEKTTINMIQSQFDSDSETYFKSVKIIDDYFQSFQTGEYVLRNKRDKTYMNYGLLLSTTGMPDKVIIDKPIRELNGFMSLEKVSLIQIKKSETDVTSITFNYNFNPSLTGTLTFYKKINKEFDDPLISILADPILK